MRSVYSKKERPRLHALQPHVNRRAQQLINAHMGPPSAGSSSSTAAPFAAAGVLSMLDGTTSRAARTYDISHLCDQPRNLAPCMAPSMLPEEDSIWESTFMPMDPTSVYTEEDGLWHTKVFPSSNPASRTDAVMLDQWITKALKEYGEGASSSGKEELARAIEDLVPILSVALHEMARQVAHQCAERGAALEKIWRTYVELFHRVLRQLQGSLQEHKMKTSVLHAELSKQRKDLKRVKEAHPVEMRRVIAELELQFTQQQAQCEEELKQAEQDNHMLKQDMKAHHKELEMWYPGFPLYQESYIKSHIPKQSRIAPRKQGTLLRQTTLTRKGTQDSGSLSRKGTQDSKMSSGMATEARTQGLTPEVAIAQDFKRLLAVLPPEKRKAIGQELNDVLSHDLLSPSGAGSSPNRGQRKKTMFKGTQEVDMEEQAQAERLREEVKKQEQRIAELRQEIADLESPPKAPEAAGDAEGEGKLPKMTRTVSFAHVEAEYEASHGAPTPLPQTDEGQDQASGGGPDDGPD